MQNIKINLLKIQTYLNTEYDYSKIFINLLLLINNLFVFMEYLFGIVIVLMLIEDQRIYVYICRCGCKNSDVFL